MPTKMPLRCPLCGGEDFDQGDSQDPRTVVLVCRLCSYILTFRDRQTLFDDGTA